MAVAAGSGTLLPRAPRLFFSLLFCGVKIRPHFAAAGALLDDMIDISANLLHVLRIVLDDDALQLAPDMGTADITIAEERRLQRRCVSDVHGLRRRHHG